MNAYTVHLDGNNVITVYAKDEKEAELIAKYELGHESVASVGDPTPMERMIYDKEPASGVDFWEEEAPDDDYYIANKNDRMLHAMDRMIRSMHIGAACEMGIDPQGGTAGDISARELHFFEPENEMGFLRWLAMGKILTDGTPTRMPVDVDNRMFLHNFWSCDSQDLFTAMCCAWRKNGHEVVTREDQYKIIHKHNNGRRDDGEGKQKR